VRENGAAWTGIRNFQARLNLRAMRKGDRVFFYHSVSEKQVVGLAEVSREVYPDPTAQEGDWSAVDLVPIGALKKPVPLDIIKTDPVLNSLALIKQTRLSVMPVTAAQAKRLLQLGETKL
ncbi:MAG: EVE domain-containing protein, partial [Verrucomicrobiota bacterium]